MNPLEDLLEIAKRSKNNLWNHPTHSNCDNKTIELADLVIDLITQLKDAQGEIERHRLDREHLVLVKFDYLNKISHLEQRLAEAETVVKFYGDINNWAGLLISYKDLELFQKARPIELPDDRFDPVELGSFAGKTARQYLTKWGVK